MIEDDAQNGPDHVDAHRTVGLVISPYVKRGAVDSTQYTTASMVRTMEMILGLPPMTQYDQNADPDAELLHRHARPDRLCATSARKWTWKPRTRAKARARPPRPSWTSPRPDRADPDALNAILWHALKPGVPCPPRSEAPGGHCRIDVG